LKPSLALLQLADTLFPIGSFAHSDGLEAAAQAGAVATPSDLANWIDVCLDDTIGHLEGPAVAGAWDACSHESIDRLVTLDEELTALRPAASLRRASRAMGLRLMTNWRALYPAPIVDAVLRAAEEGRLGPALPVAFAVACASSGIERREAVEAYAYTRLASTVSAAMRLMAIGQTGAHALLARTLARVPDVVDGVLASGEEGAPVLRSFAPVMDLAAMRQPYLHSRLFLS
jgi:urease accessory protein